MTVILSPREARGGLPEGWVYLGKDAALRDSLGPGRRPLGKTLHREADRLRAPFLSWVAGLASQTPAEDWWAGTLAWKAWSSSDLFLLLCYQAACRSPEGRAWSAAVVEDPWLLAQLRGGRPRLAAARALAVGAAKRLRWAARMLLARARLGGGWAAPEDGAVLLYSHLGPRSFDDGGRLVEPFLPGLEEELSAAGRRVIRAVYPDATGWEAALSAHRGSVIPLLTLASAADVASCLFSRVPSPTPADFDGMPTALLLERERLHDLSRAGRCAYLLMNRTCGRIFAAARWRSAVFPWEGQPQERMLVLAARRHGVRTVGSQHTTVPRMQLPFFGAGGAGELAASPDLLLTTGSHPARVLREGGTPADRIVIGGTRRYAALSSPGRRPPPGERGRDVLVVLPIDRPQAEHLLAALSRAFSGRPAGFALKVRAHPAEPIAVPTAPPFVRAAGSLESELADCAGVVVSGSTTGFDSLAAGVPTLRYRPDSLLDLDPLEALDDSLLPTATDEDIREKVLALPGSLPADPTSVLSDLFSPLDRAVWLKAVC